jgi:hypothetical protein
MARKEVYQKERKETAVEVVKTGKEKSRQND